MQGYSGAQAGTNVHVSDLANANDIFLLNNSYLEMQGLLETINRHTVVVGMRIKASKTQGDASTHP